MATAPLPSLSPGSSDATALNRPLSRPSSGVRPASSAWSQIVRGTESDSIVASSSSSSTSSSAPSVCGTVTPSSPSSSAVVQEQVLDWSPSNLAATSPLMDDYVAEDHPESSDNGNGGGNGAKKPAWNKPSNGACEVSPVMGAVSWPALSESTRASPKSSSSDSLKALSDGSSSLSQVTGIEPSLSQKQIVSSNTNSNSTPIHTAPTRHRSMKRVAGGSNNIVPANGGFTQLPTPQGFVVEVPPSSYGKPGPPAATESSTRDHHKEAGQRGGSYGGNDHQQQRNSFRRGGNGGPHPRGDGTHHHGYVGRRDLDRGNQDWNPSRGYGSRDNHMQPPRGVHRGFIRTPPHASAPFIPPPPVPMPVRPHFGNPFVFPDMGTPLLYVPPPDSMRVPIVAPMPPHAIFFSPPDHQLHTKILNQIDYYFSNENLIKDTFLRQKMDDQGWVPIKLIAGFKKVMQLTDNIQLILDAVRASTAVEVQGDKVRKRNDWMRWIMPPVQFSTSSSPRSHGRNSHDMLATQIRSVTLDDNNTANHGQTDLFLFRSPSGEPNSLLQQTGGEGAGPATVQVGFEHGKFN